MTVFRDRRIAGTLYRQNTSARRAANFLGSFCLLAIMSLQGANAQTVMPPISIRTLPERPLIERGLLGQNLNFDFILSNGGEGKWTLKRISIEISDKEGHLELKRSLDENGFPSGIETVPNRDLPPKSNLGIFNPFYTLPSGMQLDRLDYTFLIKDEKTGETTSLRCSVSPTFYVDKTSLDLPLSGLIWVHDGHDFYSHHRRQDLGDPAAAEMGITGNPVRYAYDLVLVDPKGNAYHDNPEVKENWLGYGAVVKSPAAGRVVVAVNDVPEPTFDGKHAIKPDAKSLPADVSPFGLGNFVVIDHNNGEFSVLAHLIPGSLAVHPGDAVKQGQLIGRLGTSDAGDPYNVVLPHLHYMLMNSPDFKHSEGLPSYFPQLRWLFGAERILAPNGQMDSGLLIDNESPAREKQVHTQLHHALGEQNR